METNLIFYLVAFIGVIFHFMMKWRDAATKKEPFNFKYQVMFSVFALVTSVFLVLFKPSISEFLPPQINLENYLVWALIGYFADSVWKNIEKGGAEKLGLNN
jgi:uncharacterized membrane protein